MAPPGEFDLIDRFFARRDESDCVELGIGDDAAVVRAGNRVAIAIDTLVEGTHFLPGTPADSVGHRALAVNVSDIAAMGLTPAWFTLALTLPSVDEGWLAAFARGLFSVADTWQVPLVGGDTTRGPLAVTVQIGADAGDGKVLTRGGARVGDGIYVSGTLGAAAAWVAAARAGTQARTSGVGAPAGAHGPQSDDRLAERFLYPAPRVALGVALRDVASAAIDVSDGLAADLGHILQASGCGATVDVGALPLSAALVEHCGPDAARQYALGGGEDYELCVTIPAAAESVVAALAAGAGTTLTRIGTCTVSPGLALRLDGEAYHSDDIGFRHF